ncbi:hypothetical protein QVD17_13118 [Tagetes erecta]|uniref:Uncharacterized protein n=1 Tax=Tagetes erecta TaxID=13708 RepID=A0AAD8KVJ4_TARER|nr:hypothetical protein QVD17_13118 [Tagetes erecta]
MKKTIPWSDDGGSSSDGSSSSDTNASDNDQIPKKSKMSSGNSTKSKVYTVLDKVRPVQTGLFAGRGKVTTLLRTKVEGGKNEYMDADIDRIHEEWLSLG